MKSVTNMGDNSHGSAALGLIAVIAVFAARPAAAQSDAESSAAIDDLVELMQEFDADRRASDPSYRLMLEANDLFESGQFAEAAATYGESLDAADGNDQVNSIRARQGYALVLNQQPREGLEALDRAVADSIGMGNVAWVQLARGMGLAMLGDLPAAVTALTTSIDRARENPMAYQYRGMAYYRLQRYEEALGDFREIQRLVTGNEQVDQTVGLLTEYVASNNYLQTMAERENAIELPSGIVYVEQRAGSGRAPRASDQVQVRYRGSLRDGSEFDSGTFTTELDQVIPCWTEGVQQMRVGGLAELGCPAATAYGEAGAPGVIPGGAALVFEIELLGIE